jgi:hypothetical protein
MPHAGDCELCGRTALEVTRHHLIPRTRHTNKRNKRMFDRDEVKTRLAWLCRPCHGFIHKVLSEKELETQFNTVEALRAHPEIAKFVDWVSRRPVGLRVRSRIPSSTA